MSRAASKYLALDASFCDAPVFGNANHTTVQRRRRVSRSPTHCWVHHAGCHRHERGRRDWTNGEGVSSCPQPVFPDSRPRVPRRQVRRARATRAPFRSRYFWRLPYIVNIFGSCRGSH